MKPAIIFFLFLILSSAAYAKPVLEQKGNVITDSSIAQKEPVQTDTDTKTSGEGQPIPEFTLKGALKGILKIVLNFVGIHPSWLNNCNQISFPSC